MASHSPLQLSEDGEDDIGGNAGILSSRQVGHRRFRLPLLAGPATGDPSAEKANLVIPVHVAQPHDSCAAVATEDQPEESGMVSAVQGAQSCKGKGPKRPQQPQKKASGRCIDLGKRGQEQGHSLRTSMCF
jgi:hypothetical protein